MTEDMLAALRAGRARFAGEVAAATHRLEGFDEACACLAAVIRPAELPAAAAPQIEAPRRLGRPKKGKVATKPARRTKISKAAAGATKATAERDEKRLRFTALWTANKTVADIAAAFDCTPSYVYQLQKRYDLPKRPPASAPAAKPVPVKLPATQKAAVAPMARPVAAPIGDEETAIATYIATKGVTRAADFGVHQQVVDAARSMAMDCIRLKVARGTKHWSLNGAQCDTNDLYSRVNGERKRRGLAPLEQPRSVAGE